MPNFCAVYDCTNRSNREDDRSFHRIPKVGENEGEEGVKLSTERRQAWFNAINRKDMDIEKNHNRVCSDHFVSG